jgi:hypothetical protein
VGEDTRQIEREIRETRSDLGRNLRELEGRARELADWRSHYRKHPGAFIGTAFGLGAAIGLLALGRRRASTNNGRGLFDNSHDPMRPIHPSRSAVWSGAAQTGARAAQQFGDTWNQIAEGLLRLASDKAVAFVAELVPGLRDHLDRPPTRSATYPPATYPSASRHA